MRSRGHAVHLRNLLELCQKLGTLLREISNDARIAEQPCEIASCQHEMEMIGSIGLLGNLHLAVQLPRLPFHQGHLLMADALYLLRLRVGD